jgi:hypothetical protein
LATVACSKKPGGKCSVDHEAECKDKGSVITCHEGKWLEMACRGPKGCSMTGKSVDCDQSLATPGEACETEGNPACASDKKGTVKCDKGKWVADRKCDKGCEVKGNIVECD